MALGLVIDHAVANLFGNKEIPADDRSPRKQYAGGGEQRRPMLLPLLRKAHYRGHQLMTVEILKDAVFSASSRHFRLVLLIGPPRTGKTRLLQYLAESEGLTVLNLNLQLAERLLELTQKQRPVRVQRLLGELVEAQAEGPVLLDNIELLFGTDLSLDPLRVLQQLARNRTIIAAWPGDLDDGALTYAEPGHPEAQRYIDPEATVVLAEKAMPDEVKAMGETEESK